MTSRSASLPAPTPEKRRVAVENFERAKQVLGTQNYDYAIQLLLTCCKIEPGNLLFRQTLRRAQKEKHGNNMRGSRFAFLSVPRHKARLKAAKAAGDYPRLLDHAEQVLTRNPWDLGTQTDMAGAFEALGFIDLAVFTLDQARQKFPRDAAVNRGLARLFEKRGDWKQAIALWQLVREVDPKDVEAAHKAKDLAASETIARGQYEESVSGSKTSPVLDKINAQNADKADKGTRETAPLLKRIEADPTEPSLYISLAAAYRKAGQPDRARATLQQGLAPTGNHFSLALELLELDLIPLRANYDTADANYKAAKARPADADDDGPTVEDLHKLRARLAKEINTREIELFRARADRQPGDAGHRLELGVRLIKADLIDEAIAELQVARKDEKLKGRAALHLGKCFQKRNNWRLARRNFEDALAALPPGGDDAARKDVSFALASGSAADGDLARALDLGHELANLDYGYKGIGKLLDEWQTKLQQA